MGEWIPYNKTWGEFVKDRLNKPGTLIEIEFFYPKLNDTINTFFLIGDINEDGGYGHGGLFDPNSKLIRYKYYENIKEDLYKAKRDNPSIFGPHMGTWSVTSLKDPRWNNKGRCRLLRIRGGSLELMDWMDQCREKYGDPPDDLICHAEKDE